MNLYEFMISLGMKTILLSVAALLVWGTLTLLRCRIPQLHRVAWGAVLVLGVVGAGLPLTFHFQASDFGLQASGFDEIALVLPMENNVTYLNTLPEWLEGASGVGVHVSGMETQETVAGNEVSSENAKLANTTLSQEETSQFGYLSFLPLANVERCVSLSLAYAVASGFAVWLGGIVVIVLFRARQYVRLLRHLKTASPPTGKFAKQWEQLLAECKVGQSRRDRRKVASGYSLIVI